MSLFKPITPFSERLITQDFLERNEYIFDVYASDFEKQQWFTRISFGSCWVFLTFENDLMYFELKKFEFRSEGIRVPSFFDDINTKVKTVEDYYRFLEAIRTKVEQRIAQYNGNI